VVNSIRRGSRPRSNGLDFVRATAIVWVMIYHAMIFDLVPDPVQQPAGPGCPGPPDLVAVREGDLPACGAVAAMISKATGVQPYFVGKPNPLMMRAALNKLQAHSESTVMIGDRMDTDVVAGLEAGMRTVLVLTGITHAADIDRFPFRPSRVVDSIADLVDELPTA